MKQLTTVNTATTEDMGPELWIICLLEIRGKKLKFAPKKKQTHHTIWAQKYDCYP